MHVWDRFNKERPSRRSDTKPVTFVRKHGCWLCNSHLPSGDYPRVKIYGRGRVKLSRVAYELSVGPIPAGMLVRHTCDNRRCINPAHLVIGTNLDNSRDAVERKRHAFGNRHGCAKLNESSVRFIRTSEMRAVILAKIFEVSLMHIYAVRYRVVWKHVV